MIFDLTVHLSVSSSLILVQSAAPLTAQRRRQINKSDIFSLTAAQKKKTLLFSHTPRASGSVCEHGCLNNCNICRGFRSVCVFRAGTGPCLHLPSVYIVMCLMRRDHSFVKQHVGWLRWGRCVWGEAAESSVRVCVRVCVSVHW